MAKIELWVTLLVIFLISTFFGIFLYIIRNKILLLVDVYFLKKKLEKKKLSKLKN